MGTRGLVIFEEDGKEVVVMYRQFDSYLEGLGKELAEFLAPIKVVNGFGMDDKAGTTANGMGCLAAQAVAHFKGDQVGNVYLMAAGTRDCWEEYRYTISSKKTELSIKVEDTYDSGHVLFSGPVSEYASWLLVEKCETCGQPLPDEHNEVVEDTEELFDWTTCGECGEEMKHWNHRVNHYAKWHPTADVGSQPEMSKDMQFN